METAAPSTSAWPLPQAGAPAVLPSQLPWLLEHSAGGGDLGGLLCAPGATGRASSFHHLERAACSLEGAGVYIPLKGEPLIFSQWKSKYLRLLN